MSKNVLFMIESGIALDLIKTHIAERIRVDAEVRAMAKDLGVNTVHRDRVTGAMSGACFEGAIHADFTKPARGQRASFPRKGSEWAARLAECKGYPNQSSVISDSLGVPLCIDYQCDGGSGHSSIGNMLSECGFLYLSEDGPYAMWVPDVPRYVAEREALGHTVAEPAKSFKLEFDGCRRIDDDEWEVLVLQRKLAEKQAAIRLKRESAIAT